MKGTFPVNPFIGMGAEVIPLCLQEIVRQPFAPVAVIIA